MFVSKESLRGISFGERELVHRGELRYADKIHTLSPAFVRHKFMRKLGLLSIWLSLTKN